MRVLSPLRYPGGKSKIADFVKQIVKDNNLLDGVYVEPYAGGAAVALSLLVDEYVSRIVINDRDRSIYAFWYSVLNDTERLCQCIADTPVTMETWRIQRKIQLPANKETAFIVTWFFYFIYESHKSFWYY